MAAVLSLIRAVHPAASTEAWRLEGAGLDEDATAALVSERLGAGPHVRVA
jgi:hypothetical protein